MICTPLCDAGGPYNGVLNQPLLFDGTNSTDPDGTIISYLWDFGDGATGTGAMTVHTYNAPGTYTVELCVTDDDSLTACCLTSAHITITSNHIPNPNGLRNGHRRGRRGPAGPIETPGL